MTAAQPASPPGVAPCPHIDIAYTQFRLKNGLNVMEVHNALQVASIGLLVIVALLIDSVRGDAIRGRA